MTEATCGECNGDGVDEDGATCTNCDGKGTVEFYDPAVDGPENTDED